MTNHEDELGRAGLRFFGAISASVTHEVKNALAIVRELSGLLSDLAAAADRGQTLEPGRVRDLCGRIASQVGRADETVGRMNRFAHSVDSSREVRDLRDLVVTLVELCGRFADLRRVRLESSVPDDPVAVETDGFLVAHALFLPIRRAIESSGEEGRVRVTLLPEEAGGARVAVGGGVPAVDGDGDVLAKDLVERLGAVAATTGDRFELRLPARMPEPATAVEE